MTTSTAKKAFLDPEEVNTVEERIKSVAWEVQELLIRKNRSYGNSALNPVRVFSRATAAEGIKMRIDDKLSRLAYGSGEFNEDTILDLLGYLILLRIAQENEAGDSLGKQTSLRDAKTISAGG